MTRAITEYHQLHKRDLTCQSSSAVITLMSLSRKSFRVVTYKAFYVVRMVYFSQPGKLLRKMLTLVRPYAPIEANFERFSAIRIEACRTAFEPPPTIRSTKPKFIQSSDVNRYPSTTLRRRGAFDILLRRMDATPWGHGAPKSIYRTCEQRYSFVFWTNLVHAGNERLSPS